MGQEFERKYAATPQILDALAAHYPSARSIRMQTDYYDTSDAYFSAQRSTLRLRREDEALVCTFKTSLPDGSRGEWECPAADMAQGLARLRSIGAPLPTDLRADALHIVCGARFTRRAALLATADGSAELALDEGVLLGGGRELPLCEMELELKSGSRAATEALADRIAHEYGLVPEEKSKFRRASELATGGEN